MNLRNLERSVYPGRRKKAVTEVMNFTEFLFFVKGRLEYRVSQKKYKPLTSHNTASIASVIKIRLGLDR